MNRSEKFLLHVCALNQFRIREGHCAVPATHVERFDGADIRLGNWVNYTRQRFRKGELPPDRCRSLEMFPGWEWGPLRPGPRRKETRDSEIRQARLRGQSLSQIARNFRLSRQRVHQIVTANQPGSGSFGLGKTTMFMSNPRHLDLVTIKSANTRRKEDLSDEPSSERNASMG